MNWLYWLVYTLHLKCERPGKRCRVITKAGFPDLRALENNFTRTFVQTQGRQEVYSCIILGIYFPEYDLLSHMMIHAMQCYFLSPKFLLKTFTKGEILA
jgi:hypothetical protein